MTVRAAELRHCYTLADLEHLARIAVVRDHWHQAMHPADRFDLSFSAMAEHLYASDEPPGTQRPARRRSHGGTAAGAK
jgi:hypothetical protein